VVNLSVHTTRPTHKTTVQIHLPAPLDHTHFLTTNDDGSNDHAYHGFESTYIRILAIPLLSKESLLERPRSELEEDIGSKRCVLQSLKFTQGG
jgi:hypothetical protein